MMTVNYNIIIYLYIPGGAEPLSQHLSISCIGETKDICTKFSQVIAQSFLLQTTKFRKDPCIVADVAPN